MQYDEMIVYYLPFADLPNRFWRICPTVLTTLPHRFCRFAPSFLTHLPHFSFFVLIAQIWRLTGLSYWTFFQTTKQKEPASFKLSPIRSKKCF